MMAPLQGVGVLVTRPEHQATPLCALLESLGASAIRFPAVVIEGVDDATRTLTGLEPIGARDLVVVTSANAVRFGARLLQAQTQSTLAAIGPATARALAATGLVVDIVADERFDSEGLLAHPALRDLDARRVLLLKGRGGRNLLTAELGRRGATVVELDVYRRRLPTPSAGDIAAVETQLGAAAIDVVTATSTELALNLMTMATPAMRERLGDVYWLTASTRVAESLRASSASIRIIEAASADDQDLTAALLRWRSSVSDA